MELKFRGVKSEINRIRKGLNKAVIRKSNTVLRQATLAALKSYMKNSPVWSGELVRNYRVAIGRTPVGFVNPIGGAYAWDGKNPGNEGDAALGEASRRAPNVLAALAEANAELAATNQGKTLSKSVNIKNTVNMDKASLAEIGALPTKAKSRYPGGLNAKAKLAAIAVSKGLFK